MRAVAPEGLPGGLEQFRQGRRLPGHRHPVVTRNAIIPFRTNDRLVGRDEIVRLHVRVQAGAGREDDVEVGHRPYPCRPRISQTSIVAEPLAISKPSSPVFSA